MFVIVLKNSLFKIGGDWHKILVAGIVCIVSAIGIKAQISELQPLDSTQNSTAPFEYQLKLKNTLIPSTLILVGMLSVESDGIKILNSEVREEVLEHIDERITIDDFLQHVPGASVYALNVLGVKGKHNFKDRTLIYGSSLLIMSTVVTALKNTTHVIRPDSTSYNSFPSGHTATAFVNAEFLFQEYKDVSFWYGVAGYAMATSVGMYRVFNNRHWMTDVMAGAGIGILSAKLSYFLVERIQRKRNKQLNSIVMPYYNTQQVGVTFSMHF